MAFTNRFFKLADITEFFKDASNQRARGEKHFEANHIDEIKYDAQYEQSDGLLNEILKCDTFGCFKIS